MGSAVAFDEPSTIITAVLVAAVAGLAASAGIGGGSLYVPLFLIFLGLPPQEVREAAAGAGARARAGARASFEYPLSLSLSLLAPRTRQAVPISHATIFASSIIMVIQHSRRKHPHKTPAAPLMDLGAATILASASIATAPIGVFLNLVVPEAWVGG